MLKQNLKYFIFVGLMLALLTAVQVSQPKRVNYNKTFLAADKIPFGCKAFYDMLEGSVFKDRIKEERNNIYKRWSEGIDEGTSSSVFINDRFGIDEVETNLLLDYVAAGNNVIIAANIFEGPFADTLNLNTNLELDFFNPMAKMPRGKFYFKPGTSQMKTYSYDHSVPPVHFTSVDSSAAKVIAVNEDRMPVFISQQIGRGKIYLLSIPEIFTNYNFVNHPSRNFAYTAMSYVNAPVVYYDEHYKTFAKHIESDMQFIYQNDSLYAAYITALLLLLVYMIFNLKRKQRAIPIITPPSNSTIDFVEVIGNVYYHSKNHKAIAEEMILSFLEMIRNKFQVNTYALTNEALIRISSLSTINKEDIDKLFALIEAIEYAKIISEEQLIELHKQIEQFNLKNKR